jgi:hypothetical protein
MSLWSVLQDQSWSAFDEFDPIAERVAYVYLPYASHIVIYQLVLPFKGFEAVSKLLAGRDGNRRMPFLLRHEIVVDSNV